MKQTVEAFKNWWDRIIDRINNYLLKKSFKAAQVQCRKRNKKMWIVLVNGEYVAMSKQEFKIIWKNTPAMKWLTIQQWQERVYEFKK
jgi:hypothetical protein